jgi:hypothetical protein
MQFFSVHFYSFVPIYYLGTELNMDPDSPDPKLTTDPDPQRCFSCYVATQEALPVFSSQGLFTQEGSHKVKEDVPPS